MYSWDRRGRLATVSEQRTGESIVEKSYTYDWTGLLLEHSSNGSITNFTYDRSTRLPVLIGVRESNLVDRHFVHAGDLVLGESTNSSSTYFFHDRVRSVTGSISIGEQELEFRKFSPFGETIASTMVLAPEFGFNGQWTDADSGLVYLRQRFYDPSAQRLISRDPFAGVIEQPLSLHPYQYAYNNPLRFADPSGEFGSLIETAKAVKIVTVLQFITAGTRYLGAAALSGPYIAGQVSAAAGLGRGYAPFLIMGMASGNANGVSIGAQIGGSASLLVGLSGFISTRLTSSESSDFRRSVAGDFKVYDDYVNALLKKYF